MTEKIFWICLFTADIVVACSWIKTPEFVTWHLPIVTALGLYLGSTFKETFE